MLTELELQALSEKIDLDVAREAHVQAEKRLQDVLGTKQSFEQKAFTLFGAYTTLSFALIGVAGTMFKDQGVSSIVVALGVAGSLLIIGVALLLRVFHARNYGVLGSNPEVWLQSGTIDGGTKVLPLMLTYMTFHHQNRIKVSIASNNHMAKVITQAIYCGLLAPLSLLAILLVAARL
jgi:hypothetical protein